MEGTVGMASLLGDVGTEGTAGTLGTRAKMVTPEMLLSIL